MRDNVYSVSEVNRIIKDMLETHVEFVNIQIQGEISNFRKYASGHCYFTLKDRESILKAVMFRGRTAALKFSPKDGDNVLAIGRIGVYERDGVYQLYVDLMLTTGAGDLMAAYEKLKKKLENEGLFAAERKKELPLQAQRIGIITSSSGAAVRDIITVAHRRNPGAKLVLFPVKVQGNEAKNEIVKAINFMNKHQLADVLIVGRGGGSIEDLWAFNEEKVVRAIAGSAIPIVTAVGHETDFTLADFASARRAATPSQAAEIVVFDVNEQIRHLLQLSKSNVNAMKNLIEKNDAKTIVLRDSWVFKEPDRWLADKKILVDDYLNRLTTVMEKILQAAEHKQSLLGIKLNSLSPLAIMGRGYSIAQKKDGTIIKNICMVAVDEQMTTVLADGIVLSQVKVVKKVAN